MRLIDADKLFEFLSEQLDKETGMYSKGRNVGINIARSALHDKTITPTIDPLPNEPLDLEELQEMDGEPVLVRFEWEEREPCWMLISSKQNVAFSRRIFYVDFSDYGETWLVYRRKPEEVAEVV